MPSIYDTPDENNPNHQGETFVYDAASKDINDIRQAYQQSAADIQKLHTLANQLAGTTKLALERLETIEAPLDTVENNALLTYIYKILDVRKRVNKACRELVHISYACLDSARNQGAQI